jgi:hypothetical protein
MNIMDISTLFATGTATIELKHPVTGAVLMDDSTPPKPMSLTVLGAHTKEYKAIKRKITLAMYLRNKGNDIELMSDEEKLSAMELNEDDELQLRAATVSACNITVSGEKLKCKPDVIADLLSDEKTSWIDAQYAKELDAGLVFFGS